MLHLKNIRINEQVAEADFYPENEKQCGHISVDLKSEEISEIINVPGYELVYPGHARKKLAKMAQENDHSNECVIFWY
ncbi:MAG: hypothetical protein KBS74_03650 [Clostridiales bacterium]|nr:hypothetical protein [Candidatus Cacconaster stercorequi]